MENLVDTPIISFAGYDSIKEMASKALNDAPENFEIAGHSMGGRVAIEVYRQSEVSGRQRLLDPDISACRHAGTSPFQSTS